MIEIIYKEEKKNAEGNESFFRIPNNIRQIGEIRGSQKIYIEDYAYTFLKKISRNAKGGGKAAILYGKYHWSEGNSYLFIKSALQIDEMEVSQEHIVFSDKIWGQVYEDGRKYFQDQEIVGWFVSLPGFNMQINEVLLKTHLNHFAGNDKTLFIMEPGEWEEAFFLYESSQLIRQSGYYIYYEKNDAMQEYMIDRSQNKSIEETEKIPDRAVIDFRKAVRDKNEEVKGPEKENGGGHRNTVLGACAAAAVLAVGITFFNSYQNMQGTVGALIPGIGANAEEEVQSASSENVQTVPGITGNGEEMEQTVSDDQMVSENQTILGSQIQSDDQSTLDSQIQSESEAQLQEESRTQSETPVSSESQEESDSQKEEGQADSDAGADVREKEEEIPQTAENAQQPDSAASQASGNSMQEYIIRKGDTLSSICKRKYGTIARMNEICQLNEMSADDIIYAGEKILLPD